MKTLDNAAKEFILEKRKEGLSYRQIADLLNDKGYRAPLGGELVSVNLSQYMVKHGIRSAHRTLKPNFKVLPKHAQPVVHRSLTGFISLVIKNKDLNDKQKIKVLGAVI